MAPTQRKIAVIGLGYVGLPIAVAFAEVFERVIGYDRNPGRIHALRHGLDATGEVGDSDLAATTLHLTDDAAALRDANFYIIAVPTPIDHDRRPDLSDLREASATVGRTLGREDVVVFESTVYPGVTEDICVPILAQSSGLVPGCDFTVGYSPERINPGDPHHRFRDIVKVVAGQDERTLGIVADVYGAVVRAGVHRAPSIQVAEASKVIENVQRDLNIALMNELATIFDRLHLDTHDVLTAAATKWNFLPFHPGLVGGHCIGVDPYYLTARALEVGIEPRVILAGRAVNDGMARHVAHTTARLLEASGHPIHFGSRIAVLGLSFKENVPDTRNSKAVELVGHLTDLGADVLVHDPVARQDHLLEVHGLRSVDPAALTDLAAVILAVPHPGLAELALRLVRAGASVLVDIRAAIPREHVPRSTRLWRL